MTEVVEAAKLQQIINKIETIEQEPKRQNSWQRYFLVGKGSLGIL